MKQLPDILTSVTFWASIGTLWAAAGAWFTYVAAASDSRRKTYDGVTNLIAGLEEELMLVSQWASGEEGSQGYLQATRGQLIKEHTDWFNPSRMIFTFDTPNLHRYELAICEVHGKRDPPICCPKSFNQAFV